MGSLTTKQMKVNQSSKSSSIKRRKNEKSWQQNKTKATRGI
jgi:hypothetical protein